jgi:hypothetical protein
VRSIRVFAVAALAAGVCALPATAASAATLHPTKEFVTPTVIVTTTTGAKVHFSVDMLRDGGATLDVDLNKGNKNYSEDHDWSFDVAGSSLTYANGKGTLLTGKQLGAYGSLRLSFTKKAQATRSCQNDNGAPTKVTSVKAAIQGVVAFKARSSVSQPSKWGAVRKGTSTSKYHFGYNYAHYVTSTNGRCGFNPPAPSGNPDCVSGTVWQGPMVGVSSVRLVTGAAQQGYGAELVGMRMVSLSYPAGAMRMDFIGATAPDPVLDTTGANAVLTVSTTPGSVATGSATLTATAAPTAEPTSPCNDSGTAKTESIDDYSTADYANGSTPLTVASMVGDDISVPDATGQSSFSTFSYA